MLDRTNLQQTSVYLPKRLHAALRMQSLREGATMSGLIIRALEGPWNLKEGEFALPMLERAAKELP